MYLYNTTFIVEDSENAWWRDWMHRIYVATIHDVAPNANFEAYAIDQHDNVGSTNYSCQWRCETLQDLGAVDTYTKSLCKRMMEAKGESCLFFSTMMKRVEL